jgi:hypothetical protein
MEEVEVKIQALLASIVHQDEWFSSFFGRFIGYGTG